MRQLLPEPIDAVDPADVYADVPPVVGRPSVRLNMISSVDGATVLDGVSGALGGPADRAVFRALRSRADMVLVAAGTARAERYGPVVLPASTVERRLRRGQAAVPPIAVVSRSCRFDWSSPFFTDATARPVVITVASADPGERRRAEEVADVLLAGETDVDPAAALDQLAARGVRALLAEGGPTLNGELAVAGLIDELCLTVSPLLAGGGAARIVGAGTPPLARPLRLHGLCEEQGFLFLRYRPG